MKGTFFVLTENINSKTEYLIERIIKEGHIVASHDHDHSDNNGEDQETFRYEFEKSLDIVDRMLKKYGSKQQGHYFRFPYGAYGKCRKLPSLQCHERGFIRSIWCELYL